MTKDTPMKELVQYPEWQKLRKELLHKWMDQPLENCAKIKHFLGDNRDIRKLRIVMNYLTGTGFRTGRIKHVCITLIRKEVSAAIKKYKELHKENLELSTTNEQILKMDASDLIKSLRDKYEELQEQGPEPTNQEEEQQAAPQQQEVPMDPNAAAQGMDQYGNPQDPGAMDPNMMGMDPMGGMGGELKPGAVDPTTGLPIPYPEDIGKIYELTKIYYTLKSLDTFLLRLPDTDIIKMRNLVKDALDLFKVIVDNINSYKDKFEDIIIMYYKFIKRLMLIIEKYYKDKIDTWE
jgi:hypothetical protein